MAISRYFAPDFSLSVGIVFLAAAVFWALGGLTLRRKSDYLLRINWDRYSRPSSEEEEGPVETR